MALRGPVADAHDGTRLSGYVAETTLLRPDSLLANPEEIDLHLHGVTVDPSPLCRYYGGDAALVPLYTRRAEVMDAMLGKDEHVGTLTPP